MAYGTKYWAGWHTPLGARGRLYIQKKDYTGSSEKILLQDDAVEISNSWSDTETPVVGIRCEFFVVNNYENYFHLFELVTSAGREFKIQVVIEQPETLTLFEGFLNVESISHGYLHNQVLRLAASSYLSKLEFLTPNLVKRQQNVTFINLIDAMLRETGAEFNIRVNARIYSTGSSPVTGTTLFNLNGINTEAFWESDKTYKSSLDILTGILLPLCCYIYWWDGYWYIEQFSDIWQETIDFVEYQTGQVYMPDSIGTVVTITREVQDIHSLRFKDTSQEINGIPGNRLITIKFNSQDSLMLNLFAPMQRISQPDVDYLTHYSGENYALTQMDLRYREWTFFGDSGYFYNVGIPSTGIMNGFRRTINYDTDRFPPQIGTCFKSTIKEDTTFDLSFTYTEEDGELKSVAWSKPSDLEDLTMIFSYMLFYKLNDKTYVIKEVNGIWWTWETISYNQYLQMNKKGSRPNPSDEPEITEAMSIIAEGRNFNKKINGFALSANIKVGEVCSLKEGHVPNPDMGIDDIGIEHFLVTNQPSKFYFVLGWEVLWKYFKGTLLTHKHWSDRNLAKSCHYGDFKLMTSNDVDYDYIEGSINTDFLDKQDFEFSIGDNGNLNYTNGILQGTSLTSHTKNWVQGGKENSIIEWFFIQKYRMYNATKQKIKSQLFEVVLYKPFSLFVDSKQGNKKFILTSYLQQPSQDSGEIELTEYDNETEVELNDVTSE